MKRFLILFAAIVSILLMTGETKAIPFSDTIDWDNLTINNSFTYTHDLGIGSPGDTLDSATLEISHRGNSDWWGEVWFVYGEDTYNIGQLSNSLLQWKTDEFTLSSDILNRYCQVFYANSLRGSILNGFHGY